MYSKEVDQLRGATIWLIAPSRVKDTRKTDAAAKNAVDSVMGYMRERQSKIRTVRCSACGKAEVENGKKVLGLQKVKHDTRTHDNEEGFSEVWIDFEYPVCLDSPNCTKRVLKMAHKQMDVVMEVMGNDELTLERSYPCHNEFCGKTYPDQSLLRRCGGCKLNQYCDAKCQREDWPRHKASCSKAPKE